MKIPVVAEVRSVREALLRCCGYDLGKLARHLKRRGKETGLKDVRRRARRIPPA